MTLEPFKVSHITPKYLGWLNDKSLMCYSEQRHKTHDEITALGFYCVMRNAMNPFWAVVVDGEHVGNVAAYIDRHNGVADLSILIGEKGKGYGAQAWGMAINKLFDETSVRKIEAGTMSQNVAMLRIFEKSGMTIEGRRVRHFQLAGWEHADLVQACKFRGAN